MANNQDKHHDMIVQGRTAAVIAGACFELLDKIAANKLALLVSLYRANELTHERGLGLVAEMSVLQEVKSEVENRQRRAELAMQREVSDA